MSLKILSFSAFFLLLLVALVIVVYQEFGPVQESGLAQNKIRNETLVADFFYPKKGKNLPLVVAFGGSGGGFLPEKEMKSLALEGFAVLSVAYFNFDGLPDKIEEIPLEYFEGAIHWAGSQSVVNSSKVVALGVSRGAELALLLGSFFPEIKAIVAYAPGCFVLPNAVNTLDTVATHSSWTFKRNPLPFGPLNVLRDDHQGVVKYRHYIEPLLEDDNKESYIINIQNAKGPILMLSGDDDQVWPSSEMAIIIEHRLIKNQFAYDVRNVIFSNAGHSLFQFQNNYQFFSSFFFNAIKLSIKGRRYEFSNGGSRWSNMLSKRKAREETLRFLNQFK